MGSYSETVKNYTISTIAKTITFTDYTSIVLERILLITDITLGTTLYQFNSTTVTGTVATNVLTLSAMAGVSNTDKLNIVYANLTGDPTYETPALPSGAATSSLQTTGNTSLASIATNTGSGATSANQTNGNQKTQVTAPLGSTTAASSVSTVLSNDYASTATTKITDGTNIANVVAGDTGFNGVATTSATKSYTFTTTGTGAQVLGPFNCIGFSWITIHNVTNTTSGMTLTGQASQTSGGTYNNMNTFQNPNGTTAAAPTSLSATATAFIISPVIDNYFQINVTALTSGIYAGTITLSNHPASYTTINVGSNSATGSAVPANAFYLASSDGTNLRGALTATGAAGSTAVGLLGSGVLGIYNSSAPTVTNANYERLQLDVAANLKVYLATTISQAIDSITTYPFGHSYSNITTATTTTVKSGAGTFHAITVNTAVASATLTIYDNTAASGTKIGTITLPSTITGVDPFILPYDIAFATGLTIVTSGSTDVTVSYR